MKDLVDEIIADEFASPDLELHWLDEDDSDPETILADRVKLGALTLNEMRSHLGLDPYVNGAADRPMVLTATGYVPIEAGTSTTPSSPAGIAVPRTASLRSPMTRGSMLPLHPTNYRVEPGNEEVLRKYSPDQPRVPAGYSEGGQWTGGGGIGATTSFAEHRDPIAPTQQHASAIVIKHPGAWTGDPRIDETTDKLVAALAGVMETIKYLADMTPQRHGQLVHQAFATAVVAEGLPGIGTGDVETTFPEGPYGLPGSIRTDVVLRDDDGNIIAIYDVKTGEANISLARANQLRAKTGAPSETPVIQVRFNEALSKIS